MTRILTRFATFAFAITLILVPLAIAPSVGASTQQEPGLASIIGVEQAQAKTVSQDAEEGTATEGGGAAQADKSADGKADTDDKAAATDSYVIDEYELFSKDDRKALEESAKSLAKQYEIAVYLLIVDDIGNEWVRDYAKNYYKKHELGYGEEKSGILFLIAVDSRDYVTITYGKGTYYYTDYEIGVLEDIVTEYLGDNEWLSAAQAYYEEAERPLAFCAEHGEPLDSNNDPNDALARGVIDFLGLFILIIVIPAIIAGFACLHEYNKMKTARIQTEANSYVSKGGFELTASSDRYLSTELITVPLPDYDNDSSGGSSSGSTVDSDGFGGSSGGKF